MKRLWIVILVLPILANAQIDTVYVKQWDVVRGIDGVAHSITSPTRWKGNDWLKAGGVVAGVAALSLVDENVRNFFSGKESHLLDQFQKVGNYYGKPYTAVGLTGGMYLVGMIFPDEWAKETGLILFSAVTTSTITQTFFKSAIGRARPNEELGNYETEPFSRETKFHSFPSGHATFAFTVSMVMARRVKAVPLKIFFYSMGTLTAASRLYLDVHWFSDVAFGGAIAWFCADAAVKRLQANRYRSVVKKNKIALSVFPYPGGLTLCARL